MTVPGVVVRRIPIPGKTDASPPNEYENDRHSAPWLVNMINSQPHEICQVCVLIKFDGGLGKYLMAFGNGLSQSRQSFREA
jgi:hypothetical protein